jgi:hypothetical protein
MLIMEPGRTEDISHRIELAFAANPEAVLSSARLAREIGQPIASVSYALLRLAQTGKLEEMGALSRGASAERLYRLPTGGSQ